MPPGPIFPSFPFRVPHLERAHAYPCNVGVLADRQMAVSGVFPEELDGCAVTVLSPAEESPETELLRFLDMYRDAGNTLPLNALLVDERTVPSDACAPRWPGFAGPIPRR